MDSQVYCIPDFEKLKSDSSFGPHPGEARQLETRKPRNRNRRFRCHARWRQLGQHRDAALGSHQHPRLAEAGAHDCGSVTIVTLSQTRWRVGIGHAQ
jgi:hypothetical protein